MEAQNNKQSCCDGGVGRSTDNRTLRGRRAPAFHRASVGKHTSMGTLRAGRCGHVVHYPTVSPGREGSGGNAELTPASRGADGGR